MSRNRLLIRIRKARVSISFHVQSRNRLKKRVMSKFVLMAILYSAIDTTVRFWRRRVVSPSLHGHAAVLTCSYLEEGAQVRHAQTCGGAHAVLRGRVL